MNTYLSTVEYKKQNKWTNRTETVMDTENILIVARQEACWGMGERGKEINKYKLVVTE